jgi:hypothetical protein
MSRATTSSAAPSAATDAGSIVPVVDSGIGSKPEAVGAADLSAAIDRLFPPLCSFPATADAIAQHGAAMARLGPSPAAVTDAAAMHAQALALNPGLAALFRTKECADDVASLATVHDRAPAAVEEARRRYARVISESLGPDAPAARAVLEALAAEDRRLAEQARRAEEEAAAAARAAEEERAAARAEIEALKAEVAESLATEKAAAAAHERAAYEYRKVRGKALARRLEMTGLEAIRDHVGRLFSVAELIAAAASLVAHDAAAIERALDRHEAEQEAP